MIRGQASESELGPVPHESRDMVVGQLDTYDTYDTPVPVPASN